MNKNLTQEVKELARELGAELVGIASVDRFKNAPIMLSPQGLLPTAKSVVVVGVIWLDASIELTEKEIAENFFNPYDICEQQTNMNQRLNSIVFNLAKFLENKGYSVIRIKWSNYQKLDKQKKENFVKDLIEKLSKKML